MSTKERRRDERWYKKYAGSGVSIVSVISAMWLAVTDIQEDLKAVNSHISDNKIEMVQELRKLDNKMALAATEYVKALAEMGVIVYSDSNSIVEIQKDIRDHLEEPGHPVMEERVNNLEGKVGELRRKLMVYDPGGK